jgi:hypothetical protein
MFSRSMQPTSAASSPRTTNNTGRVRGVLSAAVALAAAIVALGTATAQAAPYANVFVSYPTWLGNCPAGGSVSGIYAANGALWSTPASGDWGDDLIYPRVNLNAGNQISAQPYCSRPWYRGGDYWGPAVSANIRPTRSGQTFWIGPAGQAHN